MPRTATPWVSPLGGPLQTTLDRGDELIMESNTSSTPRAVQARTHTARAFWRGLSLVSLLALAGVLTGSNAWATTNPSSVTVAAGTCWGSSYTYKVTVTATGSGSGNGAMVAPTGLPAGVTSSYTRTALVFSTGTPSDT